MHTGVEGVVIPGVQVVLALLLEDLDPHNLQLETGSIHELHQLVAFQGVEAGVVVLVGTQLIQRHHIRLVLVVSVFMSRSLMWTFVEEEAGNFVFAA